MPKKNKKRSCRTITFKVYLDDDADILDWWDGIEAGERSDAIRDMIREFLGLPVRHRKRIQIPGLHDMHRDILWIHNALNDMPDYLQNLMQQLASSRPVIVEQSRASPDEVQDKSSEEPPLDNDEQKRRVGRMRNSTW
jgi:hypothetical protein